MNPVSDEEINYMYGNDRFNYENINKIEETWKKREIGLRGPGAD